MPWWSWVIIWVVLVLAMLAMFALFAVRLFRGAMGVFADLEQLTEKLEIFEGSSTDSPNSRSALAVLQRWGDVASQRDDARLAARDRREARHEARLVRARALTAVDASDRTWFSREIDQDQSPR